jgi:hypothetical protein
MHHMFQQQLRSRWCQQLYFRGETPNVQSMSLTADEWEATAQFEAVIGDAVNLNFTTQIDSQPNISHSWLAISQAKNRVNQCAYRVVKLEDTNIKTGWEATTPFNKLPMKVLKAEELSPEAQQLRTWLSDEFDDYLGKPDDDQLRALWLDPDIMTTGRKFLAVLDSTNAAKYIAHGRKLLEADVANLVMLRQVVKASKKQ